VAALLGLDQDIASGRPVVQHRPPGAPALDQAGVPQNLQMAPHRPQPLTDQPGELGGALRGAEQPEDPGSPSAACS
jgi:hypothetical protein